MYIWSSSSKVFILRPSVASDFPFSEAASLSIFLKVSGEWYSVCTSFISRSQFTSKLANAADVSCERINTNRNDKDWPEGWWFKLCDCGWGEKMCSRWRKPEFKFHFSLLINRINKVRILGLIKYLFSLGNFPHKVCMHVPAIMTPAMLRWPVTSHHQVTGPGVARAQGVMTVTQWSDVTRSSQGIRWNSCSWVPWCCMIACTLTG